MYTVIYLSEINNNFNNYYHMVSNRYIEISMENLKQNIPIYIKICQIIFKHIQEIII